MRSRLSTKYVAETFFIIVISFVGLAAVYYGMVSQYTQERQLDQMSGIAEHVCEVVREENAAAQPRLLDMMELLSESVPCKLVLMDANGRLLLSTGVSETLSPEALGSDTLLLLGADAGYKGQLTGLFSQPEQVAARSVSLGDRKLIVVVSGLQNAHFYHGLLRGAFGHAAGRLFHGQPHDAAAQKHELCRPPLRAGAF